ncbi:hypothetical protein B0H14DRAFT_2588743 [Mycena olivaceomarginata]|nr:hypothetical protein B0H14DRAFT_2588743 [Mycena olivaceomarginata]
MSDSYPWFARGPVLVEAATAGGAAFRTPCPTYSLHSLAGISARNLGSAVRGMSWGEVDWLGADSDSWGRESSWLRSRREVCTLHQVTAIEREGKPSQGEGLRSVRHVRFLGRLRVVGWLYGIAVGSAVGMHRLRVIRAQPRGLAQNRLNEAVQDRTGQDRESGTARKKTSTGAKERDLGSSSKNTSKELIGNRESNSGLPGIDHGVKKRRKERQKKARQLHISTQRPRVELGSALHPLAVNTQGEGPRSVRHIRFIPLVRLVRWLVYGMEWPWSQPDRLSQW